MTKAEEIGRDLVKILRARGRGRANMIKTEELVTLLRLETGDKRRTLRLGVRAARRDGHVILSTYGLRSREEESGYFYGVTWNEWITYAAGLRAHALDILTTWGAMERSAKARLRIEDGVADQMQLPL